MKLTKRFLVVAQIFAISVLFSSTAWAQSPPSFSENCPAPSYVASFQGPAYTVGVPESSPVTENQHKVTNPYDFEVWQDTVSSYKVLWGDSYDPSTNTFQTLTWIEYPTKSNGDLWNTGTVWLFLVEFCNADVELVVLNKAGQKINYTATKAFSPTWSNHFNIYIEANEPIAKVGYSFPCNESGLAKTCAY